MTFFEKKTQFTLVSNIFTIFAACFHVKLTFFKIFCALAFLFRQRNLANFNTKAERQNSKLRLYQAWIVFCFLLGFC